MKISISENADPNYVASVVKVGEIRNHPDPKVTKLKLITIYGNQVIVGPDTKEGDKVVYFPVESCIAAKYLAAEQMYRDKTLNSDPEGPTGYFEDNRRVKAIRLQKEVSQGIIIPIGKIANFFGLDESAFKIGLNFDTVGDFLLVGKYVSKRGVQGVPGVKSEKGEVGITKLLKPNQFKFHSKTVNLGMAVHAVKPNDTISISSKAHGTSAVFGNLLCSRPLDWKGRIAKYFGVAVVEEEYKFVYSSRSVMKNRRDGTWTEDVWGLHGRELESLIPRGITLYGEIVGFTPTGGHIQSGYDYGCVNPESEFWVYRVTFTDDKGNVLEFDWQQVNDFCKARDIKVVPTYFHGKAKDLFDIDHEDTNWSDKFLELLRETFLDKKCELCKAQVIREGICLRVESSTDKKAWKFKSPLFLLKESADRDKGESNLEEES